MCVERIEEAFGILVILDGFGYGCWTDGMYSMEF